MDEKIMLISSCLKTRIDILRFLMKNDYNVAEVANLKDISDKILIYRNIDLIIIDLFERKFGLEEILSALNDNVDINAIPIIVIQGDEKITIRNYIINGTVYRPLNYDVLLEKINGLLNLKHQNDRNNSIIEHTLRQYLNKEIKNGIRGNFPVTFLLVEFETLDGDNDNDEYIDDCLKVLRKNFRETDTVIKYDSKTILMIFPFTKKDRLPIVEKKVKRMINDIQITEISEACYIYGATFPDDGEDIDELFDYMKKGLDKVKLVNELAIHKKKSAILKLFK